MRTIGNGIAAGGIHKLMPLAVGLGLAVASIGAAAGAETITISGFAFKPATLSVPVGTTVEWVNNDGAPHIVADKAGKFRSITLNKGDKFSQTFSQAGTIDYFCGIHSSMTAKIIVGP